MIILTFINAYLPGYKAGGPIQSLANLVEDLGSDFRFKIVTSDRDCGDSQPYSGVRTGIWESCGNAEVLYLAPGDCSLRKLYKILRSTEYDILYLNSFFNPIFTLIPLLLWQFGLVARMPLVIAPRGELSAGALQIKPLRKRIYQLLAKSLGLYRRVIWQASNLHEEGEIRQNLVSRSFGEPKILVAPDLTGGLDSGLPAGHPQSKKPGRLSLLFASRISPKKNLLGALECLFGLVGEVDFHICGPVDDEIYWRTCQELIAVLPPNVTLHYLGPLPHDRLLEEMGRHDLFFLPTLGENFGHAIVEALSAGCPVLLSDETPWRDLEAQKAGWDLPLVRASAFHDVLQRCVDMNDEEHRQWRAGASALAATIMQNSSAVLTNRELFFRAALSAGATRLGEASNPAGDIPTSSRTHFDDVASFWETKYQRGGSFYGRAVPFVRCLQGSLAAGGEVLDFGCGSGDIAMACEDAGYKTKGIDLSPAMIARARLRSYARGITFDLLESDNPFQLPYRDSSFDAVIASSVFEYVRDPVACLTELRRVCKPEGILLATVPNIFHPRRWLELALRLPAICQGFVAIENWRPYGQYLTLSRNRLRNGEWSALLDRAGWKMTGVQARNKPLLMLIARRGIPDSVTQARDFTDSHRMLHAQP